MRRNAPILTALALLAGVALPAAAQDFRAGVEAAERGDFAAALREWRPLAQAGSATAQASLAELYAFGRGVPPDIAEALRWYRLAAAQGYSAAQFNLGQLLSNRQAGDLRDDAEARRWYALAADQGNAEAHYKLGLLHANGAGGAQDFVAAHRHWSIAEALGNDAAGRQLDSLAKLMPAARIAEAQRGASDWMTAFEQRSDEVARLRQALANRETEADRLRQAIAARRTEAAALHQTLAELNSAIAGLRAEAQRKAATVAALAAPPQAPPAAAAMPAPDSPAAGAPPEAAGGDAQTPVTDATPSVADGNAAYQAGDYERAFDIWQGLARQGDARAQFHLGALYLEGSASPPGTVPRRRKTFSIPSGSTRRAPAIPREQARQP